MSATTLVDHFRAKAADAPGRLAYTFPADAADFESLTRGELDGRARAIAALLEREGLAGERVLLLYPPGLDFVAAFLGCLYGGAVAVPAYPPGSKRALPKIAAIVGDARPAAVATTSAQRSRLENLTGEEPGLHGLRWLATDEADGPEPAWSPPRLGPESLAFLQYTSGSTAAPKGVMVSHGNLLHNEEMIRAGFDQSEASVIVGWLPLYHDMGLIGNVLQPLYLGAECHLMSPISFLRRPHAWLRAISRHRATTSGGPNFAYDLCVEKVRGEDLDGLDLSSWRVAFNGSEPVRAETLERFAQKFSACGFRETSFYPCYGLAEATLFVTGADVGRSPRTGRFDAAALEEHRVEPAAGDGSGARELVSSGRAWRDQEVAIVDPETFRRRGEGTVGEIWIAGGSVARGYWRQPEKTTEDFGAHPAGEPGAGPFLRTGDLGFLDDGELFVTGRHKDLVILRGRNHYPQDLERTAEKAHPALRPGCGAAFSVDTDGEERLILAWELERGARAGAAEVAAAVRQEISQEHEVQVREVVLLRPGSIPKTTSGKIRRHACRADYLADRLTVVDRDGLESAAPEEEEVDPTLAALGLRRAVLLVLRDDERLPALVLALRLAVAETAGIPISRVSSEEPVAGFGLDAERTGVLAERIEKGLGIRPRPESLPASSVDRLARELLAGL